MMDLNEQLRVIYRLRGSGQLEVLLPWLPLAAPHLSQIVRPPTLENFGRSSLKCRKARERYFGIVSSSSQRAISVTSVKLNVTTKGLSAKAATVCSTRVIWEICDPNGEEHVVLQ